jgi:hypothetical protein
VSTRSRVGVLNEDNTIRSIYVHSDGYPSYMGVMLRDNYKSITKIVKMLELGDCSVLQEDLGRKHNFDERNGVYGTPSYGAPETPMQRGWSCFYGRDRGQEDCEAETHKDMSEFISYQSDAEWLYLYKSGEWLCSEAPRRGHIAQWLTIDEALALEEKEYRHLINA